MRETPTRPIQEDIKSIQKRIQEFKARSSESPSPTSAPMVEIFPATTASFERGDRSPAIDAANWAAIQQRLPDVFTPASNATHQPPTVPQPSLNEALRQLEAKAQHINQLSVQQEAAMQDLKVMAERLERDWRSLERQREPFVEEQDLLPLCEYQETLVPFIERNEDGAFVLSSRSIDLFRAEREATLTAQSLRTRVARTARPHPPSPSWGAVLGNGWTLLRRVLPAAIASKPRRITRRPAVRGAVPETINLGQALLWVLGAAIARKLLNLVLIAHPGLWMLGTVILISPALFAAYRATVAPASGMVWLYRLLAILVGLLIGGRV